MKRRFPGLRGFRFYTCLTLLILAMPVGAAQSMEADRDLRFALQMLKDGMARSAVDHFRDFVEAYPLHPRIDQARLGLAQALSESGDSAASDAYRDYLRLHGSTPAAADARFGLAQSLFAAGRWAEARAAYNEFRTRHPGHSNATIALYYEGMSLVRKDQAVDAVPLLQEAASRATGDLKAEASFQAAAALFRAKKNAEAAEALSVVARSFSNEPAGYKAWGMLGDMYYRLGEYARARDCYSEALKGNLTYEDDLEFWRAFCAVKSGDTATGVSELLDMASRYPTSARSAQALRHAADLSDALRDTQTAMSALRKFVDLPKVSDEDRAEAWYNLGRLAFDAGRRAAASEALLEVLRLDRVLQAHAEYLLGLMALEEGKYAEAESYLRSAETGSAGTELEEQVLMARLELLKRRGDARAYSDLMARLSRSNSPLLPAVILKGAELLDASGDQEAAGREYERVIKNFAATSHAHRARFALGVLRYTQARYAEAEKNFRVYLDSAALYAGDENELLDDAWYWIGFSRYQLGNMEPAIEAFLAAAKLPEADKRMPSLYRAADAYFTLSRYDDALKYYEAILKDGAADSHLVFDAMFNRATTLRALGRSNEARDAFLEVYAKGGSYYEEAHLKACEVILIDQGRVREAAQYYEEAAPWFESIGRREEAWYRAAEARVKLGEHDSAVELYERVAGIGGGLAPEALYRIGTARLARADSERARWAFQTASDSYDQTPFGRRSRLELAALEEDTTAMGLLVSLIDAAPNDPTSSIAYLKLGLIARRWDQDDTAVLFINKALENLSDDEDLFEAKWRLGEILLKIGRVREGRKHLEQIFRSPAYRENPARGEAGLLLAKALIRMNLKTDAVGVLKEISEKYPGAADSAREIVKALK